MKNKYKKTARISEDKFKVILKMFCADIPALTIAGIVGVNVKSVQRMFDRFRLRILELTVEEARPFAGEVEVDEP